MLIIYVGGARPHTLASVARWTRTSGRMLGKGYDAAQSPIPHAIRPSVVDWNNTEALLSRLTLRRLNQPALTGESLCYGSGNSPTDELHGGLNKWPSYSLWPPISPALLIAVAPGRRLLACTKLPKP